MEKNTYTSYTDEQLLMKMHEDENAFNELYNRYYRLVYYIAYKLCHNDADAKDVSQETFLRVKQSAHQIKEPARFKAWLNVVTTSRCKNLFKRNHHQLYETDFETKLSSYAENRIYMLPEAQMHYDSDEEQLSKFILRLPDSQREAIILKFYEQRSIQDIARMLDISEGTVKSRIHYGKDLLQGMIEDYNRKNPDHKLNFRMLDILAPASIPLLLLSKNAFTKVKSLAFANPLIAISSVIATVGITSVGAYSYVQAQKEGIPPVVHNVNKQSEERDSRTLYFHLMDWAACESDMDAKSTDEYEKILPIYEKLKSNNDEYYVLLKKMKWEQNFETVFKK